MSILKAQLLNAMGAYLLLHREEAIKQIMTKDGTLAHCKTILSEAQAGNQVGIPNFRLSEVIQGYQKGFNPKGELVIEAEKITQRRLMMDILIEPDDLVGKWEGYRYDESKSRKDMPITKYLLDMLLEKVPEDREEQVIYKGVYVAPTANVAGPAVAAVDGFGKVIADAITAGKYAPFAMGAFTLSDTFEYMEEFFATLPAKYKFKKMKLFMSPDVLLNYQKDKRNTHSYKLELAELTKLDFSRIELVALDSMIGSNRIFATFDGNLTRVIHKNKNAANLEIQDFNRSVKLLADWHEAYGIATFDYFWSNDQV